MNNIQGDFMKHTAQINVEFLKLSTEWKDFSRQRQLEYLKRHPKSRRKYTADFVDPKKETKQKYMEGLKSWVKHEPHHKKLAVIEHNFMTQYLPEKFYSSLYDEDLMGPLPEDLYDRLVKKYELKEYLDEESGGAPEKDLAVIDEQSETTTERISGGEYLRIRIATGLYNGKRMIITSSERTGLADVKDKDGNVVRKMPYAGEAVQLILGI